MAHTQQERYSSLVDAKLRNTLVTAYCFNNRYEGNPKAGAVKVPVRNTEVMARDYNKATGLVIQAGATTYHTITIDKDKAVNELIDGFDAQSVPDGIIAERLDSAGYSLAQQMDADGIAVLESKGSAFGTTTAITKTTVYDTFVDMRTAMSTAKVPNDNRVALVSPAVYALLLKSAEFIKASALGDAVVQTGAVGEIAGFKIFESNNLDENTEIIALHPQWCHRVEEWQEPIDLVSLKGSGTFIGASAVQGRKVYAHDVTNALAVQVKKNT